MNNTNEWWNRCIPISIFEKEKQSEWWRNICDRYKIEKNTQYMRPDWDLKQCIFETGNNLLNLMKELRFTEYLVKNLYSCKGYYTQTNENLEPILTFEFNDSENICLVGSFWQFIFVKFLYDYEEFFNVKFNLIDLRYYMNTTSSDTKRKTIEFIKLISSTYTLLEKSSSDYINNDSFTLDRKSIDVINECEKICNALYKKRQRIIKKVKTLIEKPCIFLTFTFNDKCLSRTTENTRRQKIRRILTEFKAPYLGNIDYGKDKEREHYHVIIQVAQVDASELNKKYHKYGCVNFKKVSSPENYVTIANYINKLTNHALKKNKVRTRLLYDRI